MTSVGGRSESSKVVPCKRDGRSFPGTGEIVWGNEWLLASTFCICASAATPRLGRSCGSNDDTVHCRGWPSRDCGARERGRGYTSSSHRLRVHPGRDRRSRRRRHGSCGTRDLHELRRAPNAGPRWRIWSKALHFCLRAVQTSRGWNCCPRAYRAWSWWRREELAGVGPLWRDSNSNRRCPSHEASWRSSRRTSSWSHAAYSTVSGRPVHAKAATRSAGFRPRVGAKRRG